MQISLRRKSSEAAEWLKAACLGKGPERLPRSATAREFRELKNWRAAGGWPRRGEEASSETGRFAGSVASGTRRIPRRCAPPGDSGRCPDGNLPTRRVVPTFDHSLLRLNALSVFCGTHEGPSQSAARHAVARRESHSRKRRARRSDRQNLLGI